MPAILRSNPFRPGGFIALVLIGLILVVQYAGSWYALEIIQVSKEEELEKHLVDLGRVASDQLEGASREIAALALEIEEEASRDEQNTDGTGETTPASRLADLSSILRPSFDRFARRAGLESLTLLDGAGRVLISTSADAFALEPFDFIEIDADAFETALDGKSAGSLAYEGQSSPIKRVYVPVVSDREAAAVICLTAGRDYLAALGALRQNMRILAGISTMAVLLVGLLVSRLLARQNRIEQRASHADRLQSLGSLAAGFAHEVRNPLEIIGACTGDLEHLLLKSSGSPPDAIEACQDIHGEVSRLNRLVNQFLEYARSDAQGGASVPAALAESVSSVAAMLSHSAGRRDISITGLDEVKRKVGPEVRAPLDDGRLRQVILNLMMNAIQATPDGGRVHLEAELTARTLKLTIIDGGEGVAPGMRSRIFDPFFTTREKGSGLGLSIAHQLAIGAGGGIECIDPPAGSGACFVLTLPRLTGGSRSIASGLSQPLGPTTEADAS